MKVSHGVLSILMRPVGGGVKILPVWPRANDVR
jgi:hypothetical protein